MSLQKVTALKEYVSNLQRETDKAQGVLESVIEDLKKDFDCDTIQEAEKLLEQRVKEEEKLERKFDKALARFEEEWGDVLS